MGKALSWQETLCKLIGFELRNGVPMELINLPTFKESSRQARNVEESLMVVLHACALVTAKISNIAWPTSKSFTRTSFGELLSRLQGQRESWDILILRHLGFLNLKSQNLLFRDMCYADLSGADLSGALLIQASLSDADLSGVNFSDADLSDADLSDANPNDANLFGVKVNERTNFEGTRLEGIAFERDEQILKRKTLRCRTILSVRMSKR